VLCRAPRLVVLLAAGILILAGCTSADPRFAPRYGEYKVGPMSVFILDEGTVNLVCQTRSPQPRTRYEGCYIRNEQTVVSSDDVGVLLHELKHALEPDWQH
jgi:hypothetical protein